jgi:hypothetical protein
VGSNGWEGRRKGCGWEVMPGMGGEEERLEEEANNCSPPVRFPIRPVQCTIHNMSIFIPHLYTVQRTIYTVAYDGQCNVRQDSQQSSLLLLTCLKQDIKNTS